MFMFTSSITYYNVYEINEQNTFWYTIMVNYWIMTEIMDNLAIAH